MIFAIFSAVKKKIILGNTQDYLQKKKRISNIPGNTQEYPEIPESKKIPENT